MKESRFLFAIALPLLAMLCGCAKIKYPAYYTLSLPPAPDPPAKQWARATIAVREFGSPKYLRQGVIVYRTSPEEIGFYNYHRWAEDPRQSVSNAIAECLRMSGRFARVKPYDGHADVDYVLTGRLDKLEEVDNEDGVHVDVALSAQLYRLDTGEIVWTDAVREVSKVHHRDVPGVVSQMSRSMNLAVEKLLVEIPDSPTSKRD